MKLGKLMDDKAFRRLDDRFVDDGYELLMSDSNGKKKKFKDKLKELSKSELRDKARDYGVSEEQIRTLGKKELRKRICDIRRESKLGLSRPKKKKGGQNQGQSKNKIAAEIRNSRNRTSPAVEARFGESAPKLEVVYDGKPRPVEKENAPMSDLTRIARTDSLNGKKAPPFYFDEQTREFVILNADTAKDLTVLQSMQSLGKIRQRLRPDDGFGEMMDRLTHQLMHDALPPVEEEPKALPDTTDVIDADFEVVPTPEPPVGLTTELPPDKTPDVIEVDVVEVSDAEAMSAQLDAALDTLNGTAEAMRTLGKKADKGRRRHKK